MSDLIDREHVREFIKSYRYSTDVAFDMEKQLDLIPTTDAVPVVRCKDCKYGLTSHGVVSGRALCMKPFAGDTVGSIMHSGDWFCGDGVRKEQDDGQS